MFKAFIPPLLRINKTLLDNILPIPLAGVLFLMGLFHLWWGSFFLGIFLLINLKGNFNQRVSLLILVGILGFLIGIFSGSRFPNFLQVKDFFDPEEGITLILQGTLISDVTQTRTGARRAELKITQANVEGWEGRHLFVMGLFPPALRDDRIQIEKKKISRPKTDSDLEKAGLLWIEESREWQVLESFWFSPLRFFIFNTLEGFWESLPPQAGDWLRALFLGDRTYLLETEKDLFIQTGLIHVLALSGFHLGFWTIGIFFFLGLFISRHRSLLFLPFFLFFYVFLVGFYPSLVRAWFFVVVWVFYKRCFWAVEPWSIAFLTMILSLVFSPALVYSVGFWLSLLAFTALITDRSGSFWLISLRLFFFTSPVLLLFFHQVPLIGFLLTPLISLLIAWLMLGGFIAGIVYFWMPLIPWFSKILGFLLEQNVYLIEQILIWSLPFSFPVGVEEYLIIFCLWIGVFLFLQRYPKMKSLQPFRELK
jgi:ComEC/Rec2-related protein